MSTTGKTLWPWLAAGVGVACWAGYELAIALLDASQTGMVTVNSYSTVRPRHVVTWPRAWAFVLGLVLTVWAGLSAVCEALDISHRWRLPSVLLFVLGFSLVLFSAYLSSLGGIAFLGLFSSGMALLFYLQRRYGQWAAVIAWSIIVAIGLYWMTRSPSG